MSARKQRYACRSPDILAVWLRSIHRSPPGSFETANKVDQALTVNPNRHALIWRVSNSRPQLEPDGVKHLTLCQRTCEVANRRRHPMQVRRLAMHFVGILLRGPGT